MLTALLLLLVQAAATPEGPPSPSPASARIYERVKASVVTVEVHSGNREAKSALGSGYVVSAEGTVVTNYHVVESLLAEPERYELRVRTGAESLPATVRAFDLENDLAVLSVPSLRAAPLSMAPALPAPGSPIVALGNPHGLGLSLIEGIFNGLAAKGAVDRMLLSMPLNSGMSGGPILDAQGRIIGTNVSVLYLSNSLSFGVPAAKIPALLTAPPVVLERAALRKEVTRQLDALEASMVRRAVAPYTAPGEDTARVGGAETRRPPEVFECWDDIQVQEQQGMTKARFGCDLQFTPSIEDVGPVGMISLLVEHFRFTGGGRYGFYAHLEQHAPAHLEVQAQDPEGGTLSAPECVSDRVAAGAHVWKTSACVSALVEHPGFFNYDLVATTVTHPTVAAFVAVHMKGVRPASFRVFTERALGSTRLLEAR
ncbi:MAG TPA: serine protease [Vicinamibacteria bacterium]|nr:serine protease [Vicinamibacteria bacterium]